MKRPSSLLSETAPTLEQPQRKRQRLCLAGRVREAFNSFRRGVAFVWLHYVYEPCIYRRRRLEAHEILARRPSELADVEAAVKDAELKPFRAQLPADASSFLEPHEGLRPSGIAVHEEVVPRLRAALRIELEARRTALAEASPFCASRHPDPNIKHYFARVPLEVTRCALFDSAVEGLLAATPDQLLAGVHVRFVGRDGTPELGVDSGGLSREFLNLVISEIISEDLRTPRANTETYDAAPSFFPEPSTASSSSSSPPTSGFSARPAFRRAKSVSGLGEPMFRRQADHALMFIPSSRPLAAYYGLGRLFAVALVHASYGDAALPWGLNDCLLKYLVGQPITAVDVRRRDPQFYKNRIGLLLEPGGPELIAAALGMDQLFFEEDGVELKPGGAKIPVTKSNLEEYVRLLSEEYVCGKVRRELSEFLSGFHGVVPRELMRRCGMNFWNLGTILSGVPEIDVEAWKMHSELKPSGVAEDEAFRVFEWFWAVLRTWTQESRSAVLAFATGCSRVPAVGFSRLEPAFTLEIVRESAQLPTTHTCFHTLTLPAYGSSEILEKKLSTAIRECASGFELR